MAWTKSTFGFINTTIMKSIRITHLITKGLLSIMMTMSAGMYLFKNADINAVFESLGFPSYIVIPLALLKIAGILTIWFAKDRSLKEWAYAGFTFNFILAASAHIAAQDGEVFGAILALVLLLTAYFTDKKLTAA